MSVELVVVCVTVNRPETGPVSSASLVLAMLTVAVSLSTIVTVAVSAPVSMLMPDRRW